MKLEMANEMMEIVNKSILKVKQMKEDIDTKRMHDKKAQLIYEGIKFCYLEMLEMQGKLDEFALQKLGVKNEI